MRNRGLIAIWLLVALTAAAGPAQAEEAFQCQTGILWLDGYDIVLVATARDDDNGSIQVSGTTITTDYEVAGINRRWDWETKDGTAYAFVIEPDGSGHYVDFSRAKDGRAKAEQDFICKEASTMRELAEADHRQHRPQKEQDAEQARQDGITAGSIARYMYALQQKIERNWVQPPSADPSTSCVVNVTQLPSGEVVRVVVESCNGDENVMRSVEAAVQKASPLPRPEDPNLFERELRFIFEPTQD